MSQIDERVWQILTEEEKTSLSLTTQFDKSSWEAGEILGKAHYKYLEIKSRAERFIRLFISHFEKYDELFPLEVEKELDSDFVTYINLCIFNRYNVKKAVEEVDKRSIKDAQERLELFRKQFEILSSIKSNEAFIDTYSTIMEFDRWNNFRILPRELQEPSAFKRRVKVRDKKHLSLLCSLPGITIANILRLQYTGNKAKLYVPVMDFDTDDGYHILPIHDHPTNVKFISNIGLYVFKDWGVAKAFGSIVYDFMAIKRKSCRQGQTFWPKFREISNKAVNYKAMNNIIPYRKYFENTDSSIQKALYKENNKKAKGEKKAGGKEFWKD